LKGIFADANIVMDPITSAIALWLGEWATVAIAGKALEGIKQQFSADEWGRSLKQAIQDTQSKNDELFAACRPGGLNGVPNFLQDFFQSGEVLRELQKPLQNAGKPSVEVLSVAFEQQAQAHPNLKDYKSAWLKPWMTVLIDHYFDQIKGICFQVAKAEYLQQLAQRVDDIKFVGIAVPGETVKKQENLAKIFVMPTVQEEKRGLSVYSQVEDDRDERAGALRDRQGVRFLEHMLIGQGKQRAVLLGAPGSGKSTLLNYLALRCCPQMLEDQEVDDRLPIVVRIRDWSLQPELGLLAYLYWYAEKSLSVKLPTDFFEHWLERGQALILLDGLDEVPDEALRSRVVERIETFLRLSKYRDNVAVITSRSVGYRPAFFDATEFTHYTLEPFDDKQIEEFIDLWYNNRIEDKAEAARQKADLRKALKGTDRTQQLAKNPLLLTIIALIRGNAELPQQRYKLYEIAVETLLTSWDSGKELKLFGQVLQYLKPDDLLYVLKKLAYWIHTQGSTADAEGGTLIENEDLILQLSQNIKNLKGLQDHEAEKEAKRFVRFIQKRTGLVNKQDQTHYAFVHNTFQEYLTAEAIYDQFKKGEDGIIQSRIQRYLHQQHWREVLLLLVSKLKKKRAADAIRSIYEAGSDHEHWLHRDLLFAGWCLTEDPQGLTGADTPLTQGILDGLVSLEIGKYLQVGGEIKDEVTQILHRLGKTAFEADTWERLQQHSEQIEQFRLLDFQASLGQEQAAIDLLLDLLKDDDSYVRYHAAYSLGKLGNVSDAVMHSLLGMLNDEDSEVSFCVAESLVKLGNTSDAVVNAFLSLLNGSCWDIRCYAIEWLGQLGNASNAVVNGLLGSLNDENSYVRCYAVESLVQLGNTSNALVNELQDLLKNEDSSVSSRAAESLGQLGISSDALENGSPCSLKDENLDAFAEKWVQLVNASDAEVNAFLGWLKNQNSSLRSHVAAWLVQSGKATDALVNILLNLLNDGDSSVRYRAAESLSRLRKRSDPVVNALLGLLNDENSSVRYLVAESLGHLSYASDEVVNALLGLLNDENSSVRYRAAESLGQLNSKSDMIKPALVQWLEDHQNSENIGDAIDALWQMTQS
jgi:HEAT repeat protein